MRLSWREFRLFLRMTRPHFLVGGFMLYGLGAAVAHYLGRPIDMGLYLIGQVLVTSIQLMAHYLNEYYDDPADRDNPNRTPFSGGSGALGPEGLPEKTALYAAIISIALSATTASAAIVNSSFPFTAWILLILGFLGSFFYSAPPLRLVSSGYGELAAAFTVGGLLPAFSFSLQAGELNRMLIMSTTPLVALAFAMLIALQLPDYASDLKHEKKTLMIRLGWSTAMRLHDFAILVAVASLSFAYASGLPVRVAVGALILLPLAAAQIWQMRRIRNGLPPRWRLLTTGAVGLFALLSYFELTGFLLS